MTRRVEMAGERYGRWLVLHYAGKNYWLCRCDCGTERLVAGRHLRSGRTNSCGCLNDERIAALNRTHGHTRGRSVTAEYRTWQEMKRRCDDPTRQNYPDYGGRGITVCERWRTSFSDFLSDMGYKPSPEMTIDRIDSNGSYEPGNCRWATPKEQAQNRS